MKSLLLALLLLVGCSPAHQGHGRFVPEPEPPTMAQLRALMDAPDLTSLKKGHLLLSLLPQRPLIEGEPIVVHCWVPESIQARAVLYGVQGVQTHSMSPVEGVEHTMTLERMPCGTWAAICSVYVGTDWQTLRQPVTVLGECNR